MMVWGNHEETYFVRQTERVTNSKKNNQDFMHPNPLSEMKKLLQIIWQIGPGRSVLEFSWQT